MNADADRDRRLEQALTRELRGDGTADAGAACLDAETLAAWMDGGLGRDALAVAEAHAADCPRCRAMIAVVGRTASVDAAAAEPRRLWRWWLAPIAAATAATVLWVIVPSDRPSSTPSSTRSSTPSSTPSSVPSPSSSPSSPPLQEAPARETDARAAQQPPPTARGVPEAAEVPRTIREAEPSAPTENAAVDKRDAAKAETRDVQDEEARRRTDAAADSRLLRAERSAAPAAPQPAPPAAALASAAGSVEVLTPDPAVRWRVLGARVERSMDGGLTWQQVVAPGGFALTAGFAPSPDVCWLVGRAGTVLVTTDARVFTRSSFPEQVDLILVTAKDARVAAVTTVDGRVFETVDGGLTWRRR